LSRIIVEMSDRHYLQGSKKGIPPEILSGGVIFDANIWLSINGPFQDDVADRARAYSGLYKKILEAGGEVYLPQVVACEFLNRAVWIQAEADGFKRGSGKLHQAADYPTWIREACDLLNAVVGDSRRVADGFDNLDLAPVYASAEAGGLDFHDVLIVKLCESFGCVLVTDDRDYAGQDVAIITFNQRLT